MSERILVVDDDPDILQVVKINLELEGFEVVTAADGAECLDVVHQVRPDLITLDVVMPRLDGLRTAAQLRGDPRTRRLPLAIVSACTQYEVEAGLDQVAKVRRVEVQRQLVHFVADFLRLNHEKSPALLDEVSKLIERLESHFERAGGLVAASLDPVRPEPRAVLVERLRGLSLFNFGDLHPLHALA